MTTARTSPPTGILSAEGFKSYTSFGSDIDLSDGGAGSAAVAGLAGYKHCAGTLIVCNTSDTLEGTIVLMDHSGNTATFSVPINSVATIGASVQKIVASGTANIDRVTALWWASDRL